MDSSTWNLQPPLVRCHLRCGLPQVHKDLHQVCGARKLEMVGSMIMQCSGKFSKDLCGLKKIAKKIAGAGGDPGKVWLHAGV